MSSTAPDEDRDELLDTLLHPDRAHHDELGRTDERGDAIHHSSPREQPAAPIDLTRVDE